jgi:hypothetical protein
MRTGKRWGEREPHPGGVAQRQTDSAGLAGLLVLPGRHAQAGELPEQDVAGERARPRVRQHVLLGQRERLAQPAEADRVAGGPDPAGEGVGVALDEDAAGGQGLCVAQAHDHVGVEVGRGTDGGLKRLQHGSQRGEFDGRPRAVEQFHRGRGGGPDRD